MTKPKPKPETNSLPPIKPWCFRVALTTAKKRGARENWPRDVRDARAAKRKAKRKERRDPKEEEMWLRAESKRGGIDADVARKKQRAHNKAKSSMLNSCGESLSRASKSFESLADTHRNSTPWRNRRDKQ